MGLTGIKKLFHRFWETRKSIRFTAVIIVFVFLSAGAYFYFSQPRLTMQVEANVVENYKNQLQEEPFSGELLLRTARHIYHFTRERLQSANSSRVDRELLEAALGYYRQLDGNPDWHLQVEDYFFNAYLYYQLGRLYGPETGGAYNSRALDLALEAYENGFRSPELIALLANLYFERNEFETAVSYYETLGRTNDPVLLLNKARALLGRDEENDLQRADNLLSAARQALQAQGIDDNRVYENLRATQVRTAIEKKDFSRAFRYIRSYEDWRVDPRFRTLYAEYLLAQNRSEEAKQILSEMAEGEEPYPEAVELLQEITS